MASAQSPLPGSQMGIFFYARTGSKGPGNALSLFCEGPNPQMGIFFQMGLLGDSDGKNPPAILETWVRSLGWEDPLEKGTHYPLQYACLENSMDRGVWQATVQDCKDSDRMERFSLHFILLT